MPTMTGSPDSIAESSASRTISTNSEAELMEMWQARCVQNYVALNLHLKITACDLATVAQLSHSSFNRAFRASFGYTPRQYVTRMRIARAQRLMTMSRETLSEIAVERGFLDQYDFKVHFRKIVGQAPADWRAGHGSLNARTII